MKITAFTSNQPRHLALIERLSRIGDEVFAVQECSTVFPGEVDDFIGKSEIMQAYFRRVIAAESEVFGGVRFSPNNVRSMSIKMGDLNKVDYDLLAPALLSDVYIVFGASFIKGALVDALIEKRAVNIHMGVSPYYRGASCNFWAAYDENVDLVGATIHHLSRGLDSGPILFHALPQPEAADPFVLGMRAVRAAHDALAESIASGELMTLTGELQDREKQLRYAKYVDFTDEVAQKYLDRGMTAEMIGALLAKRPNRDLISPRFF